MDKVKLKWLAERIEDVLLEKLASKEICDYKIGFNDNEINYYTFSNVSIKSTPISIVIKKL